MICEHLWIVSVVVKHWFGKWLEYYCCACGTGMGHEKIEAGEDA